MPRRQTRKNDSSNRSRLGLHRLEDRLTPATILALDFNGTSLLRFNSATPNVLTFNRPITGLGAGESLQGIDSRPATGQLFGLAIDAAGAARIGSLDPVTGVFTGIGATFSAAGTSFGFDFNPTNDRIRITSDADINLLVNPNDGVVTIQGNLNPGNPNVVGSAYSNNFGTATSTTLYALDSGTDQLFTQVPATGTLTLVGNLGTDTNGSVGFDIAGNGVAFASLTLGTGIGVSSLFSVDLATGAATLIGQISGANTVVRDITVQRFVWDGGGSTNSNWTTGANWVGDIAPSAGDDLYFPDGAARTTNDNDFPDNTFFNSITVTGPGYILQEATAGANAINLSHGILANVPAGATGTVANLDLTLSGSQAFTNIGSLSLTLSGELDLNGAALTVTTNPGNVAISSNTSGTGSLTKTGAGILSLNGPVNTYAGPTLVNAGVLSVGSANALGQTGAANGTTIANGATLRIQSGSTLTLAAETLIVQGAGAGGNGAFENATLAATWTGPITLAGDATISAQAATTLTVAGIIGDGANPAGLTKVGAGTLILPSANTYRGVTTINEGILTIQNAGGLGDPGAGTTVRDGAQLQLQGGITVADEPLILNGAGLGAAPTGALLSVSGTNAWSGQITLASDSSIGADAGSLTIGGAIDDGTTGSGFNLSKELTGTLILATANTYRGTTFVTSGILTIQDGSALGAGGPNGGTTVNNGAALQLQGNFTVLDEPLVLNGLGFGSIGALHTTAGGSTVWTGPVRLDSFVVVSVAANGTQTLQNGIGEGPAPAGLTKIGPGTLAYSGSVANTYTGVTFVSEGTLQLARTGGAVAVAGDLEIGTGSTTAPGVVTILVDGQIADPSNVTINAGGILDASQVAIADAFGNLDNSGVIRFGNSVLTSGNSTTLSGSSDFSTNFASTTMSGRLFVVGSTDVDGTLQVTASFNPPLGSSFTIIDNDGTDPVSGEFSNFPEGSVQIIGGTTYQITYHGGAGGNDVVLTAVDPMSGRINGKVFDDTNGNGADNNDPGLNGVTVQLDIGNDGTFDESTTTANGGLYGFSALSIGAFRVRIVVPVNSIQTTPNPADITLAIGQVVNGVDFGVFKLVTVSGVKFNDLNGDGTRQPSDPGLGGVQIILQNLDTGAQFTTTTNGNGDYTFQSVGPGSYQVRETVPPGAIQTTVNPVEFTTFSGGNVGGGNFGNFLLTTVSGSKFNDRNGDGVRQPGDNGVPGITILLTNLTTGGAPRSATTDVNGDFTFANVGPGTYQIREALPSGFQQTTPNPANFVAISGTPIAGIVFGNRQVRVERFAVGSGEGQGSTVNVYDAGGTLLYSFFAFGPAFLGGVRVATGDITGDAVDDIIVAAGPGGGPHVKAFDGATGAEIRSFFAYAAAFRGGVYVGFGDVNDDGIGDIITGAGATGGPHVEVFSGSDLALLRNFFAYDPVFTGGVRVAGGDVNGDGFDDIITGAGPGGGPHAKVFSGQNLAVLRSFFAYDAAFLGGIYVAAGDINGDGRADVITGAGEGGGPHVKAFDGQTLAVQRSFLAYGATFIGGVRVATGDVNGDGIADILTGAGPTGGPHVKAFDGADLNLLESFFAFSASFTGGVFVG